MDQSSLESGPVMILATPVIGNLEVHVEGCQHLRRLYAAGGGTLASGNLAEMVAQGLAEMGSKPKIAGCVREVLEDQAL
jgi:hypothetical protein